MEKEQKLTLDCYLHLFGLGRTYLFHLLFLSDSTSGGWVLGPTRRCIFRRCHMRTQLIEGEVRALMMNCNFHLSLAFREGCISKLFEVLLMIHCYFIHLSQHLNSKEERLLINLFIYAFSVCKCTILFLGTFCNMLLFEKVNVRS